MTEKSRLSLVFFKKKDQSSGTKKDWNLSSLLKSTLPTVTRNKVEIDSKGIPSIPKKVLPIFQSSVQLG